MISKIYSLFVAVILGFNLLAQSDNCVTATPITIPGSGNICNSYSTAGGTPDNMSTTCQANTNTNYVWFQYTVTGTQNTVTVTPGTLQNANVIYDGTGCGDGSFDYCLNGSGSAPVNIVQSSPVGTTVLIGVASGNGVNGTFQLCITSVTPTVTATGDECSNAIQICNSTPVNIPSTAIYTGSGSKPNCFIGAGSNPQMDFYITFTVYSAGTVAWTATPNSGSTEYDWALYDISSGCTGTLTCCNYNYSGADGNPFGMVSGGDATCDYSLVTLDPAFEFSPTINATAGQVYTIRINNYSGDGTGLSFQWQGTAAIAPVASFTVNPNTVTCGPSVTATINNTSTSSANWTFGNGNTYTGLTPPTQTYSTPGTYAITATIGGACPSTSTQYVQLYAPLAGTIASTNTLCPGVNNGTASVTSVSGGNGIYTYSWSPGGATTPTVSNLAPGPYTVTISNAACGSTLVLNTTVNPGPAPTFTAAGTNPGTCGANDGSILLSGLQNSSNYSVTFLDGGVTVGPTNYTSSGTGTINLMNLNAGNYSGFSITLSPSGCTASIPTVITLTEPGAPVLQITNPPAVCSPTAVDLTTPAVTAGSVGGGVLSYWNDQACTSSLSNPNAVNVGGTYYIQTNASGCTDVEPVVVTINTPPVLSITNPPAVCSPNTVDITAAAVTAGSTNVGTLTYWNDLAATSSLSTPGGVSSSNTYYIQASSMGCTDIEPVVVTINPSPVLMITNPAAVCSPNTVDITSSSVTAGSTNIGTLTYWNDAGATSSLTSPSAIANSNTFYIQATSAGCTDIDPVTVTINPIPAAPIAGTDATYCSSWSLNNMTATGGTGTITWYLDAGLSAIHGTGGSIAPSNTVATTIYYVTETALGCEGPPSIVTITIENCEIIVPTAFTPDGDGVHDDWEIVDLDQVYPDNVVTVFNRWGAKLYESKKGNYASKPWDGKYEGSALPVGSYYFIIDFNLPDVEPIEGIVSIILE